MTPSDTDSRVSAVTPIITNNPIESGPAPIAGPTVPVNRIRTEPEAAEFCGLSLQHFRRMRRNGQGPPFVQLTERRIGYRPADLDRWLAERVVEAA